MDRASQGMLKTWEIVGLANYVLADFKFDSWTCTPMLWLLLLTITAVLYFVVIKALEPYIRMLSFGSFRGQAPRQLGEANT